MIKYYWSFISKALIDSYINHEKLVSVNKVLREYYQMRKEIKEIRNPILWNILYKKQLVQSE